MCVYLRIPTKVHQNLFGGSALTMSGSVLQTRTRNSEAYKLSAGADRRSNNRYPALVHLYCTRTIAESTKMAVVRLICFFIHCVTMVNGESLILFDEIFSRFLFAEKAIRYNFYFFLFLNFFFFNFISVFLSQFHDF